MDYNLKESEQTNLQEIALKELEFFQVLDIISKFCISDLGRQIIQSHRPFEDKKLLEKELSQVEEFRNLLLKGEELPISTLSDIKDIIYRSRITNAVLGTNELLSVVKLLRVSRQVKSFVISRQDYLPIAYEPATHLVDNRLLEKHIDEAIDETGAVRDTASKELASIRREINETRAQLRRRLERLVKKFSEEEFTRDEFYTIREGRFVLPVKVENKRTIGGIIHGVSQTGSTVYIEPAEIIELNNDLSLLENEEKREIYRILSNFTEEVGSVANDLIKSLDILAYFDSVISKAKYSIEFNGFIPKITDEKYLFLKDARHPLLVAAKGIKKVVPLSLELNESKRGLLISGPNAGGKTVALKTIGLSAAMAMSGIFPLGECSLSMSKIYTYIGDNQSIQNDLSTFSAQILRLKNIISEAFADSIVLVDEIGSGTDPMEGAAIASGILETFSEMKLFYLTTTHQSSLKTFALNREEIENASLEFDERNLKPTYKFLVGIPGNSYAFSLAKNIGLPEHVLRRARKYIDHKSNELEKSIKLLQEYQRKALQDLNKAQAQKAKAEALLREYQAKSDEFKRKKAELLANARQEAMKIFEKSNALIENTIREIREQSKTPKEIKQELEVQKQEILNIPELVEEPRKIPTEDNQDFEIGSYVYYPENNSYGKIVELDKQRKIATVEINGIKFKLKTNLLQKSNPQEAEKNQISISSGYVSNIKFDANTRLDIRGERVEVALRKVDEFINDAIMGNISMVTIIHGKGTGALRQAIQEYLRYHQSVVSFRDGDLVEGGTGVTIVQL